MTRELPESAMKPETNHNGRSRGTCEAFEARMNQWIDLGEESDIERDPHLVGCPHCQQTLQIWRQLESGLKSTASRQPTNSRLVRWRDLLQRASMPAWAMAIGACVMAVIVLRPPSTQMAALMVDSASTSSSVEVELSQQSSDRESVLSAASSGAESGMPKIASAESGSDESASNDGWMTGPRTDGRAAANSQWDRWRIVSSEAAKTSASVPNDSVSPPVADTEPGGHSVLLAQWIANSRPTMAQLSTGVAPLGRTLQRTANLFY
ncbi:hypothetical protein LOC71_00185 [Rhodopirellula sp. JC740]|uniref:Zinc-finger domain-containing protein n=1 Tax=Rhodopirellula halodulae TaxID=2894198 RepID=A0ABS8NB82_9BACT|nr:hypothetical protein [Rhodopirellula sp. JC740]MCC9640674.1 hypothetical protein [Rhodopirellula sp. JC740]